MVLVATKLKMRQSKRCPYRWMRPMRCSSRLGFQGDVVVEQDVAALEIDPFARQPPCHKYLDRTVPKLLLRVEAEPGSSREPGLQSAVYGAYAEAPGLQLSTNNPGYP